MAPRDVHLNDLLRRHAVGMLIPAGLAFFVFLVTFVYYYVIVTTRFDGRRWDLPSRIYSDVFTVRGGDTSSAAGLVARLERRGYRKVEVAPAKPGEYQRTADALRVYLQDFSYADRAFTGYPVEVRFINKGRKVGALARLDTEEELDAVQIEPELLSSMYGAAMEDRTIIALSGVPQHLVDALLVTEDEDFFHHSGVSMRGVARVAIRKLRGKSLQGGSTLTQQLIKNLYLNPQRTLKRKAVEAVMALILDARYRKSEILEAYLNEIYLGQSGPVNITGVEEASKHYFGKPVARISVAEAAQLVGMIHSPNNYHPGRHPEAIAKRRDAILKTMFDRRLIDEPTYRGSIRQPIKAPADAKRAPASTPYFVDLVRQQMAERYPSEVLEREGYHIFTTLDLDMQEAAQTALTRGLAGLEASHPRLRPAKGQGGLQGALIALDPATGYIRALVGGRDYAQSQFNRGFQARRQPGSLFKPFIYLTALKSHQAGKVFTAATLINDSPITLVSGKNRWTPQNYDWKFEGDITLREALQQSRNIPTVRLAVAVGLSEVIATARRLGIQSRIDRYPSMALGSFEVSPLELAYAYAVFANGGIKASPASVLEVVDSAGKVLEAKDVSMERIEPSDAVFLLNSLLEGVVARGTAARVRGMGYTLPVAGKTGTTNNFRDTWFVGYSPRFLCLVWVGFDDSKPVGLQGSQAALPIWVEFMKAVADRVPRQEFRPPPNVITRDIDPESGALATAYCPIHRAEYFIAGTEPTDLCPLHNETTWQDGDGYGDGPDEGDEDDRDEDEPDSDRQGDWRRNRRVDSPVDEQ